MKINNQVCAPEFSIKLRSLGVKQDSYFYWEDQKEGRFELSHLSRSWDSCYSAFSVAELGEMLLWDMFYIFGTPDDLRVKFIDGVDTEANTRAKILIYLIENKLIQVENVNKSF